MKINRKSKLFTLLLLSTQLAFALPSGFGKVKLGMSLDETKAALKSDPQFGYRGDRDVSLSPSDGESIIETETRRTAPYSFISKSWFQFSDKKLFVITMNLNEDKVDYYSVFSKLCEKYGDPNEISPRKSVWKSDSVMMSLEKPLTIKYVDYSAHNDKLASSNVSKTAAEQARDEFLESL